MTANNEQVGGSHYKSKAIQPWDYIAANSLGYFEGNIIKYVSRWQEKGGVDDLKKAQHYLQKLIELNEDDHAESEEKMNINSDGIEIDIAGDMEVYGEWIKFTDDLGVTTKITPSVVKALMIFALNNFEKFDEGAWDD